MRRIYRCCYPAMLCMSLLVVAALTLAPRAAIGTPPDKSGHVGAEPTTPSGDVLPGDLASRANEALGLIASSVVTLDVPDTPGVLLAVDIPLGEQVFTLDLVPHSAHSPDYRVLAQIDDGSYVEMQPQPLRTMRGTVVGFEGSLVAATLLEDGLYARIIFDEQDEYWVEPISTRIAGAGPGQYVVYHGDDVIPNGGSCGADLLSHPPIDDGGVGLRDACGNGVLCVAELACDADYQYFLRYGSVGAVENRINNVINALNVQYERDVDITHAITAIIVRTSSGANPYSTSDPSALLDQFRSHWQSSHNDIQRDLAELFTGRNLDGSVIGIAWLNAVCTNVGYSVVQSDCCGSFACATDLSAHEMGHNWGAGHCNCPAYTMNPGLTCSNQFNPSLTIPDIVSFRSSRQFCLDADQGCNAPNFTIQPDSNEAVCPGENVALHVEVDLASTTYQWRIGETDLTNDGHYVGVNTDTLTILGFTPADEASTYNCVVTNVAESCSDVSNNATLALDTHAPVIMVQPQDQNVDEGQPVVFAVGIDNPVFFEFQWRKDGGALSDGGRFSGTATQSLLISPVEPTDEGAYDCVATALLGGLCSTTSDAAALTVNPAADCPGDLDGDSDVDLADLAQLLGNYGTTGGATPEDGDLDGDADVDLADLAALLGVYGDTCP